jgi:hypothetical protein
MVMDCCLSPSVRQQGGRYDMVEAYPDVNET